jgi:hypothetical protein
MITLLADGEGNWQTIAWRRKRAGGVRCVGAGRVFEMVEIENELARCVESVGGEAGVEKAASAVGGGRAGRVSKDEEQFCDRGIFEDWFELEGSTGKGEFCGARDRLRVAGANERRQGDGFLRRVGNPLGGDVIGGVRCVPLEAMEADQCRRLGVLDAQSEAFAPMNDVDVERADGHARIVFVAVGIGVQLPRFCPLAIDQKPLREAARWRVEGHGRAPEVQGAEMFGAACGEMNLVVGSGAEGVVAGIEPLEPGKSKPPVRLQQVAGMPRAPRGEVVLPGSVLRQAGDREKRGEKCQRDDARDDGTGAHGESIA